MDVDRGLRRGLRPRRAPLGPRAAVSDDRPPARRRRPRCARSAACWRRAGARSSTSSTSSWVLARQGAIEGAYKIDHPYYLTRDDGPRPTSHGPASTSSPSGMADDGHWGFLLAAGRAARARLGRAAARRRRLPGRGLAPARRRRDEGPRPRPGARRLAPGRRARTSRSLGGRTLVRRALETALDGRLLSRRSRCRATTRRSSPRPTALTVVGARSARRSWPSDTARTLDVVLHVLDDAAGRRSTPSASSSAPRRSRRRRISRGARRPARAQRRRLGRVRRPRRGRAASAQAQAPRG